MIQDILPLHLQNQYEKKQSDDTSYMMIYRENKILVREGETLAFLTYRELREILARDKDFFWAIFQPEATILGEPEPLT